MKDDINIKLNIKSIIQFEQFAGKSFNQIDYSNIDDIQKLLYCVVLSNNSDAFTYDEFLEVLKSTKIATNIYSRFNKELQILDQFTNKVVNNESNNVEDSDVVFIKDIASILIINAGLDASYVMNELPISDLSFYVTAYNNKVKEQMESERLWTYLSILPHIDGSKISSPSKLYPFPWELEAQVKEQNKELKGMEAELPELLKNSASIIDRINNQTENQ